MNTKLILAVGTGLLVTSFAIIWSCIETDGEQMGPEDFRGFNENLSGTIYTTTRDGSLAISYEAKEDVYLDGGPGIHAPDSTAGLRTGDYYFQVTDPSGMELLSPEHISCRKFFVGRGVITQIYDGMDYEWKSGDWVETPCQHQSSLELSPESGIAIQLAPFDDTPNSAGVYKVWITPVDQYLGDPKFVPERRRDSVNGASWDEHNAHGFAPAHSKTTNFKVAEASEEPPLPPLLTVRKFHDANANGVQDADEADISAWEIEVNDPAGAPNRYYTPAEIYASEGLWAVREATPAGSMLTSVLVDNEIMSTAPDGDPLALVMVGDTAGETHEVVYGNVGVGAISACKVYDNNANGEVDANEGGVEGWPFELTGTDARGRSVGPLVQTAGDDGCARFDELLPGDYAVRELSATGTALATPTLPEGSWISSGRTTQTVAISSSFDRTAKLVGTQAKLVFTNFCVNHTSFNSKDAWYDKEGLLEIEDADIDYANSLAPFSAPSDYFDGGDEPFDGESGTKAGGVPEARGPDGQPLAKAGTARAEIAHFLMEPTVDGDTRQQLAQQLLAFVFNTRQRLDGDGASVSMSGGTFMAASELIQQAVDAWDSEDAATQTILKDTLQTLNGSSDLAYAPSSPCDLP